MILWALFLLFLLFVVAVTFISMLVEIMALCSTCHKMRFLRVGCGSEIRIRLVQLQMQFIFKLVIAECLEFQHCRYKWLSLYNESEQVLCTAVTQQQAIFIFPKSCSLFQETPYQHSVILHARFSIHKFRSS